MMRGGGGRHSEGCRERLGYASFVHVPTPSQQQVCPLRLDLASQDIGLLAYYPGGSRSPPACPPPPPAGGAGRVCEAGPMLLQPHLPGGMPHRHLPCRQP